MLFNFIYQRERKKTVAVLYGIFQKDCCHKLPTYSRKNKDCDLFWVRLMWKNPKINNNNLFTHFFYTHLFFGAEHCICTRKNN